jgi:hypothetical protein
VVAPYLEPGQLIVHLLPLFALRGDRSPPLLTTIDDTLVMVTGQ